MTSSKVLIHDGGMSRELIRLKAPFKQPEWSALALMESPALVKQVHAEFAAAGADIITTNSYALVPFHIGEARFWERGLELARLAGKLAREAADEEKQRSGRQVLVAGSLPPIFGSYEPQLFDEQNVQKYLSVLVEGLGPFVDVWLGETLSLIAEGEAVRAAIQSTGKPFWISYTLEDNPKSSQHVDQATSALLRGGESVISAAVWAHAARAEYLLFNCSQPECMLQAIDDVKSAMTQNDFQLNLGVYANAFEPQGKQEAANEYISETRSDLTMELYEDFAHKWVHEGATVVGGCCGVGVQHIARLAQSFG